MLTLLPLLAFAFGTLGVTAIAYLLLGTKSGAIDQRLREVVGGQPPPLEEDKTESRQIAEFLSRLGERVPRSPSELSKLRLRLSRVAIIAILIITAVPAGFRDPRTRPTRRSLPTPPDRRNP